MTDAKNEGAGGASRSDAVLERIASIEHEQWAHWTSYMLANLTEANIVKWKLQIEAQYSELSEIEKESDRYWAKRVLDAL
jgi:hypothetical protein